MTKLDLHYADPRLVDLYEIENPPGPDTDFYLRLAADLAARHILDLGCGTGILTRKLAVDGRTVIGIDPSSAMLAYAHRQPGAELVQWIEGDSTILGTPEADLVLMTSNVSQVFLDDAEISTSLRAAGFTIEHVYGDWARGPFTNASRIMVFITRRD